MIGSINWGANCCYGNEKNMNEFLTQETPSKVMGLLAASVASLAFLFAVTISNASFHQVYEPVPDTFGPAKVMAVLDVVSNSYSGFLADNLLGPAQAQFAYVADNAEYIADN